MNEIETFCTDGFVVVRDAVAPDVVRECVDASAKIEP